MLRFIPLPASRNAVSMRGEDHRDDHGRELICRVLPIAPATFHDHLAKRPDPSRLSYRAKRDEELKPEIERVFEENQKVYGVRKVWHQPFGTFPAKMPCRLVDRGSHNLSITYTERPADAKTAPSVATIVSRTDGVPRRPLGTPLTMPWPKRSTAYSKPKSFTDADHGAALRPSNTPPLNGGTGPTTADCSNPLGTFRQPRPRQTSTQLWKDQTWPRNQDKSASGKPGAVHGAACYIDRIFVSNAVETHKNNLLWNA